MKMLDRAAGRLSASAACLALLAQPVLAQTTPLVIPNPARTALPGAAAFTGEEWMDFRQAGTKVTLPVATTIGQAISASAALTAQISALGGGGGSLNIAAYPAASALAGTEAVPCLQASTLSKCSSAQLSTYTLGAPLDSALIARSAATLRSDGVAPLADVTALGASKLASDFTSLATPATVSSSDIIPCSQGGVNGRCAAGSIAGNAAYLGQIASRTLIADSAYTNANQGMFRRAYVMKDAVSSFQLVDGNFYDTSTGEAGAGCARTVTHSIEYPSGTIAAQVKWSGATSASMTDGQSQLVSDAITTNVPPRGATFWVNTFEQSTCGLLAASNAWQSSATLGDQANFPSNNSQVDATMTPGWSGTAGSYQYGPYAIIGQTRQVSVAEVGDSRWNGAQANANGTYRGPIDMALSPAGIAVLDLTRVSQQATQLATGGFAKRLPYLAYVSHAGINLGINDLNVGSRTASNVIADRQTIRLMAPNLHWFETTLEPYATSSDGFTTLANQSIASTAANTQRVILNEQVRAGDPGFEFSIDLADAVENGRNGGLWAVGANTRQVTDAVTTASSTTLTSATANFTSADVGANVYVAGAGASGAALVTYVASVNSPTSITLAATATTAVSAATARVGGLTRDGVHDNTNGYVVEKAAVPIGLFRRNGPIG